jgi:Protein of unknown function (DUF2442)
MPGSVTSKAEVTNISRHGFWLLMDDRELFLPFEEYPWFLDASIGAILNVERPRSGHLRWPELDVDLSVESIEHPEQHPLRARREPGGEGGS